MGLKPQHTERAKGNKKPKTEVWIKSGISRLAKPEKAEFTWRK
jgi:hypothetical protein